MTPEDILGECQSLLGHGGFSGIVAAKLSASVKPTPTPNRELWEVQLHLHGQSEQPEG